VESLERTREALEIGCAGAGVGEGVNTRNEEVECDAPICPVECER
jgi:hypothetical protein